MSNNNILVEVIFRDKEVSNDSLFKIPNNEIVEFMAILEDYSIVDKYRIDKTAMEQIKGKENFYKLKEI